MSEPRVEQPAPFQGTSVMDENAPRHLIESGIRDQFEHDTNPYIPAQADWEGRVVITVHLYKKGVSGGINVRNISRTLTVKQSRVSEVYWAIRDKLFGEAPKFDRSWSVLSGSPEAEAELSGEAAPAEATGKGAGE